VSGAAEQLDAQAAEYLSLSARKGIYDQVRFLDKTGMELVGLPGGDIQAKSEWGKGSEFTVTLPLRYTGRQQMQEPSESRPAQIGILPRGV